MNSRWYDTEYSIENSTTQVLGDMSCRISNFEGNILLSIIYKDEDELVEVECQIESDVLYIIDPLFKLTDDNLVDSDCINGISKKKLLIEMHEYFNNVEYESYITLNAAMLNFLNNLK